MFAVFVQAPHLIQPNGAETLCILSQSFGWDGRTDGQKLSKVATKEKKNSLVTVATFSSPILFMLPVPSGHLTQTNSHLH